MFVKCYSIALQCDRLLYIFSLDRTVSIVYITLTSNLFERGGYALMAIGIFYRMIGKSGNSYKVCIPFEIRQALNLHPRDILEIMAHGDEICMRKANPSFTERKLK